ncbi:MAG: thiamine diphosphokinase, partial [bacterium]
MNILLVANGKVNNKILSRNFIKNYDINKIIAVDGGSNKLIKLDIFPDVVIGDLDSKKIRAKNKNLFKNLNIINFPKDKDYSDLELGINYINNMNMLVKKVFCFGMIGSRVDHTLANINSLFNLYLKDSIENIIIYDSESVLFLIKSNS